MTGFDHTAEADALGRRFPGWTIWFGPFTGHWWALPPRGRDLGDFLEADTPQRLIARIEVVTLSAFSSASAEPGRPRPHRPSSEDPRPDVRRPSNLLLLEGVTPSPSGRVPAIAWPGSTAR
ncbi:hypothetical protein BZB76_3508 [Actinomadura pelletieri DSM 43383]|uniref:Uncharacterized protein n=1 Tax=Actinomadura pelletieri DSM 43383 TaxID=1120940 RepID=A0A495QQ33_9ACTN|nr:hypothetical protein [Actinomadura pelletieri]RKS74982.1 hypothetical protein BZB76_3508 [Actinomadura pelletieri DSM 43383]